LKIRVYVRNKEGILDPHGVALTETLSTMHYSAVQNVRTGRIFELELIDMDIEEARVEVEKLANDILINKVYENFEIEISS
jgi:phosphoribosylformylglycinamidine synthase